MANQATFHAKISADARQFVTEIENANQALQGLIAAYDKVSSSGSKASAGADKGRKKNVEAEIKSMQDEAIKAGKRVTDAELENIAKVKKAARRDVAVKREPKAARILGPDNFTQQASLTARQAAEEKRIVRQRELQAVFGNQLVADRKREVAEAKRSVAQEEKRVKLQRTLDRSGQVAEGPVRQGEAGIKDLAQLQKSYNDGKKRQASYEREIANLNRQQMDAMVTGRYALYDMANAYRGIAMGATRTVRALAQTVVQAAQFETSFTAVERAAKLEIGTAQYAELRDVLIQLSTEIPVAFDQISEIATLGAQMGISAGDLEDFTQNVASFSAVTGASIDETAEKFGRISSLAKVPSEEFENLASSVLYAGFNAVATEKEILSMAESIAAAASNAGYSGKQIVGLSTALASLGVQPEQARGVILRLFNDITRAAEGSTDKMDEFAAMAGYTATEFQTIWKESPEEFFNSFLNGLSNVESLTTELDKLGITNTREINVLQRLSGNMDVYTQSIGEAAQAYEEGTALADIYGKTADNLEAKFQRLVNAFDALKASSSEVLMEGLKPLIEGLIDAFQAAERFSKSGFGQAIIPIVTSIAGAVAIFAAFRFATSIVTAQLLAMRVAVLKTGQMTNSFSAAFGGLKNAITGNLYATDALGGKMQFLSKQQINAAASSKLITQEQKKQILATNKATIATRGLSAALFLAKVAMIGVVGVGLGAMIYEMTRFNLDLSRTGANAAALADAIRKDTQAYNEGKGAIATHTIQVEKNGNATLTAAQAGNAVVDSQGNIASAFADTTSRIEDQTIALGENFRQLVATSLVDSEEFQKFFDDATASGIDALEVTDQMGTSINELIVAAAEDPGKGAVQTLIDQAMQFAEETDNLRNLPANLTPAQEALRRLAMIFIGTGESADTLSYSTKAYIDSIAKSGDIDGFTGRLFKAAEQMDRVAASSLGIVEVREALGLMGEGASDASDDVDELDKSVSSLSKSLRTVLDYASDLDGIFNRVIGIEFGREIAQDDIAAGWEKIAKEASKAEDAIRDANAEILELTADKDVLEYQLSVAERYGDEKRAAIIRAKLAKIDNKLADENENLAAATEDAKNSLVDSTEEGRKNREAVLGMVSSYQALIEAAVATGMEGEELEQFIASLKEEFIEQGKAVGYSEEELRDYADLFDEFITVVEKVDPRVDIEFDSNISAAEQAFDEYMAKLRNANGYTTTQTFETVFEQKVPHQIALRPVINGSDVRLFRMGLEAGRISLNDFYKAVYGMDYRTFQTFATTGQIGGSGSSAGEFIVRADGGYVSGPGGPKSDSIPAMLSNGEYVVQASSVRAYGVDFMNALNQQRVPMGAMPNSGAASSGVGSSGIVHLSPQDRALLRAVADRPVNLYADNGKIAQSANAGNVKLAQRGLN